MSKTMLINVTHAEESRVAVLEDGVLAGYEIETLNRTQVKGNIYNAVVETVHGSLEAAFLSIAPGLKGFLPLDEVNFKLLPTRGERGKGGRIAQHLSTGQKLMVQVVREPFAGKPPSVSTYFSLPGRYLVLMPGVDSAGISRKIADAGQRDRLKKIVDELKPPEGFGLIVRTAGLGQTKAELQRDMRYLLRLWESIHKASSATSFPGLVYRERDLVIRTIRDYFTPDIREVWIDSEDTYERAHEFVRDVMPTKAKVLRRYEGERPLFNKFNLEEQIESIYKRRVPLPSGGEIVIDGTEALTAVDVNSARSSRKGDVEDKILQTNLEAAAEIARQLRLRDLGGLVVIDYIDMASTRNRKKVEKAMKDALKGDKARHDVTPISKLGLMEIARQRIKGEKLGASYATCPACEGYGLIKNVEAAALAALRKLQTRSGRRGIGVIKLKLPTEVATWMLNYKREDLSQIERRNGVRVEVEADDKLLRHESSFEALPPDRVEDPQAGRLEVAPAPPAPSETPAASDTEAEAAATDAEEEPSGGTRRRRRRRRHKRAGVLAAADDASAETGGEATGAETTAPAYPATGPEAESRPEDAKEAAEGAATAEQTADGDEATGGRRRKRRRRRRRPAAEREGSDDPAAAAAPAESNGGGEPKGGAEAKQAEDTKDAKDGKDAKSRLVPEGVVSNELMPAAVGGSYGRKRGKSGSGGGRRRRRS
jgi:ribonuclease E